MDWIGKADPAAPCGPASTRPGRGGRRESLPPVPRPRPEAPLPACHHATRQARHHPRAPRGL